MDYLIIFVAQYMIFVLPLLIGVIFLRLSKPKRMSLVVTLVLGIIFSLIGIFIASHLFYDPRPFVSSHVVPLFSHAADNGFPSDHTTIAATLAFIGYAFSKKIGLIMVPIAFAVGVARILAHVHSWPDILGGIGIAGISTVVAVFLGRYIVGKLSAHTPRADEKV